MLAVGEIGLDYHYDFSPRDVQRAVFEQQLALAAECGKPIVIHTREAWDDTLRDSPRPLDRRGIMHCFTGDETQARQSLDLGFHLSFGGVLTFPKADAVRAAARLTPGTACSSKPIAPISRPCRIAENATNRPSWWRPRAAWRRCAASRRKPSPRPPPRNFERLLFAGRVR